MKFMVDCNVGKLAKWLRMMGYDSLFFGDGDDGEMVALALAEGRVILTRDSHIAERRVVARGHLRAIHIKSDEPVEQMRQVMEMLRLKPYFRPLTICLECNVPLEPRAKEQVKDRVPPYILQTQDEYVECPACHRVYWKGTHWQAMKRALSEFKND